MSTEQNYYITAVYNGKRVYLEYDHDDNTYYWAIKDKLMFKTRFKAITVASELPPYMTSSVTQLEVREYTKS